MTRLFLATAVFLPLIATLVIAPAHVGAQEGVSLGEGFEASGEVGLRYERDEDEPAAPEVQNRFRLRAVLGASFQATSDVGVVIRFRTGLAEAATQRDSHVDVGGLSLRPMSLDRAFVRYQRSQLVATAGMVDHLPDSSSLLWDRDLSPAGATVRYSRRLGRVTLMPAAYGYVIRNDVIPGSASGLVGGQLAAETLVGDIELRLIASGYKAIRKDAIVGPGEQNAIDANGRFVSKFEVAAARAHVTFHQLIWFPVELHGELIRNFGADRDKSGFAAGARVWQTRKVGRLSLGYRYRAIKRDAFLANLSTDDFRLQTGVTGHEIRTGFEKDERLSLTAALFLFRDDIDETIDADTLQLRGRLDLTVRF